MVLIKITKIRKEHLIKDGRLVQKAGILRRTQSKPFVVTSLNKIQANIPKNVLSSGFLHRHERSSNLSSLPTSYL